MDVISWISLICFVFRFPISPIVKSPSQSRLNPVSVELFTWYVLHSVWTIFWNSSCAFWSISAAVLNRSLLSLFRLCISFVFAFNIIITLLYEFVCFEIFKN